MFEDMFAKLAEAATAEDTATAWTTKGCSMRTYGAGLWLFGQFVDRYATDAYGPPVSTLEAIEQAGTVRSRCLDINYPFTDPSISVDDVPRSAVRTGTARARNHAAPLHARIRAGEFHQSGSCGPPAEPSRSANRASRSPRRLTPPTSSSGPARTDTTIRSRRTTRDSGISQLAGLREVVESAPELQFAIEYKLKEPRNHMLFSTAARTLLGIQEIGAPNLGIVLDLGHSLFAKETPADALQLVHRHGRLVSVELNDNRREWDDDMAVGSVHLIDTLEFLIALRRIGWHRAHPARPVPVPRGPGRGRRR